MSAAVLPSACQAARYASVSALTPASGISVTMLPLSRAASAARDGSVGANQSGGCGCCTGRAAMRTFLHR